MPQPAFQATGDLHTTHQSTAHSPPWLNRPFNHRKAFTQPARSRRRICPHGPARAPAFPGRVSQAQLAETAGQPHPTENTVEETAVQPPPILKTVEETAGQPRPIVKTIVEIAGQARTPGSAGALAGMILHASTDLPNNRWHAHHPPDHRVPFASGDETACLTGLNC